MGTKFAQVIRMFGVCRDCRNMVRLKWYNLREMYGMPVVCKTCAQQLYNDVFDKEKDIC